MALQQRTDGIVLERPGVTILDSLAMEWQDNDYQAYALAKTLARDEDGDGIVMRRYCQVARREPHANKARGGYHTAREMMLCLSGELPHWEMEPDAVETIKQTHCVIFREGYWLDRYPGSIHGMAGEPFAVLDSEWINWYAVTPDPFVGTMESLGLTEEVPLSRPRVANSLPPVEAQDGTASASPAIEVNEPHPGGAVVVDSRNLPSEPHPFLPEWRQSALTPPRRRRNRDDRVRALGRLSGARVALPRVACLPRVHLHPRWRDARSGV